MAGRAARRRPSGGSKAGSRSRRRVWAQLRPRTLPLLALLLALGLLAELGPPAQARRPKARAEAQAASRSETRSRPRRRRGKAPRAARGDRKAKASAPAHGASKDGAKRVGKTRLVRLKYTVRRGDTLSRVARKLHVTVDQLRWWNRWLRKGSTLRVGARVAYLVDRSELDRREAAKERRRRARAKAKREARARGHRHAARVARAALVQLDPHDDVAPGAGPKDIKALHEARATGAELGAEARPGHVERPSTSPGAPLDAAQGADSRPNPGVGGGLGSKPPPPPYTAQAAPAPRDAQREAVARVAGAARGVVAAVAEAEAEAGAGAGEPRSKGDASSTEPSQGHRRDASSRAAGQRRATAGDFPSYRVPAGKKRAEAIGSPNHGRLLHGVEMPIRGPGFRRISTKKRFATDQTIALVRYAAARLAAQFPGTQPMRVNAMSAKGGGRVRPHHSHQNGLDVDILYFQKGNPKHPKRGNLRPDEIDYVKTWFVLETLLLTGKFNYAFTDRSFIPGLRRQARRAGWTKRALRKIFGDPSGKGHKGLIRHWPGHRDHIHIRFTCHPADKRCEHSHFY